MLEKYHRCFGGLYFPNKLLIFLPEWKSNTCLRNQGELPNLKALFLYQQFYLARGSKMPKPSFLSLR